MFMSFDSWASKLKCLGNSPEIRNFWIFSFLYSSITALLFQRILLPLLPAINAGSGLMVHDAYSYHICAVYVANDVNSYGWSSWHIFNFPQCTIGSGNLAVISLLYSIFGVNPALVIPVNALLQASSSCLLLLIGRLLWPGVVGNIAGATTAVLFLIFPSSLSWYSQPLKDCYLFCGILLILYSMIRILQPISGRAAIATLLMALGGVLLVLFVKPYYLAILKMIAYLMTSIVLIWTVKVRPKHWCFILAFYFALALLANLALSLRPVTPLAAASAEFIKAGHNEGGGMNPYSLHWQNSPYLPEVVNKYLESASVERAGAVESNVKQGIRSAVDLDVVPQSSLEALLYLPRAFQVAMFAPFPNSWGIKYSPMWAMLIVETFLWYLVSLGLIRALFCCRTFGVLVVVLFASFHLMVIGYISPNVGTLSRYRYVFEFMFMLVAMSGWINIFQRSALATKNSLSNWDINGCHNEKEGR